MGALQIVVEGLVELDIISVDDVEGVDINDTTLSATDSSGAKLRQLAVMANVAYDIPLGGNTFKPYVGVGLGSVDSHLKALGEDDGSVRFAWQLRAGAAVKVTKGIDLTADYTYRQTGSGKLNFGDEDVEYRLGKTKASLFRSEEHTSELQSLNRIPIAVFCLKKKNIYY